MKYAFMKYTMSFLCLVSVSGVSVANAAERSVTPEAVALQLIDDQAGDSWAEAGDVDTIKFSALNCDFQGDFGTRVPGHCDLGYEIKKYDKPLISGKCSIRVSGYDKLIQVLKYGFVLVDGVTDQIDTCLGPQL